MAKSVDNGLLISLRNPTIGRRPFIGRIEEFLDFVERVFIKALGALGFFQNIPPGSQMMQSDIHVRHQLGGVFEYVIIENGEGVIDLGPDLADGLGKFAL